MNSTISILVFPFLFFISRLHSGDLFGQDRTVGQIILVIGINKQQRTALDRINDRFADRLRQGRTTEAASQATG